MDLKKCRIFKS